MNLNTQFKIKNNPYYVSYLRQHSIWYKILNRDATRFTEFEEKVKEYYKLRPSDKLEKVADTFMIISSLFDNMK